MRVIVLVVLLLGSASALHADTVTATWDPNSESDIAGYLLAYGTVSGQHPNGVPVGNVTTWQLSLAPGQTYYFVVQAFNTAGLYSLPSAEAFINIPNPVASVVLSATTAGPGQPVTATIANGPGNAWDWVGLYPASATSATTNRLAYQFLNGMATPPATGVTGATLTFTLPTAAGMYNVRFFLNNSLTVLATSATITVTASSIVLSAATGVEGQPVTATVANGPGNAWDWVGLYPAAATSATANRLAYQFLNGLGTPPATGVTAAALIFTLPTTPGIYNVRFFQNNSLTVLATSGSITVGVSSIVLGATTAAVGQPVTATVANGPGNAWDWVGLYPASATSATANRLAYQFLNGLGTPPASGLTGATLTFAMPMTPGTYNVRFFQNNTLTVLATSGSITVGASSVVLSATTAVAGQTVNATIANGPGNAWDWVGLYPASASSATVNRVAYQFLNGLGTPPASGVSGATLTFTLPTAGTYNVRFFLNNTLTVLGTSATITVTP